MIKLVFALCLFIKNMEMNNKRLMCGEVEATVEKNIDGSISIDKIIKPK